MKLVEILAKQLKRWPDEVFYIVQDDDSTAKTSKCFSRPVYWSDGIWSRHNGGNDPILGMNLPLASDHSTAIITRADWEAERARIKGESKVKPNKYGWIRHRGGKQPVSDDVRVEYRMRSGVKSKELAGSLAWNHENDRSDIMAYKPIYSGFQQAPMIEAPKKPDAIVLDYSPSLHIQSLGRVYRHEGDPRKMRDRIREIDAARKEEEARHSAAMAAYDEERTSLVAKLKAEGFALIQGDEPNGEVESAQQDMSDPANWRVGDIFVITENKKDDHEFLEGTIVRLTSFDDGAEDYIGTFEYQDGRDYWFCRKESVKWHSRPPQ